MMLNIDIAILEISGPNHKINQVHYLGDRFKIAKNLKIMMESLLSAARYATPIEKRKIKLYGFHIYLLQFTACRNPMILAMFSPKKVTS